MKHVAIVGGGPAGLFAARALAETCGDLCRVTIYEAGDRLGGKVMTRRFDAAPVPYEAGVAEFYDYSKYSEDPLKELVQQLGLTPVPMQGPTVILGDKILTTDGDIRRKLGDASADAIEQFYERCTTLYSTEDYYENFWRTDNQHPLASQRFSDLLDEIPDETARRYVTAAVHTDVAAPPHLTNALNGLKNILMDDDRYLRLYAIEGGNERLIERLAAETKAAIRLNARLTRVGKGPGGRYRLSFVAEGRREQVEADYVILALPNTWLQGVDFDGRRLRQAMERHLAHYDRPAHYLRVNALFKEPFWQGRIKGSYFMQDVFGGTCLYDESRRFAVEGYGSLAWLIAGNDAMAMANLTDQEIVRRALDSLPKPLAHGRDLLIEAKVQRWVATVNAIPGGHPVEEVRQRHQPEPGEHAGLLVVGDYLFDSTVNAAYDSADFAAGIVMTELRREHYAEPESGFSAEPDSHDALGTRYHDEYAYDQSYEDSYDWYFCEHYATDLIKAVWGQKPPYRLLDVGSATGITLELFEKLGVEAWGIENSPHIHARTLPKWQHRNFLGDVREMPFEDNQFDFIYDTCLCYLPDEDLDRAIQEMFRVVKTGVYFGGIVSDMRRDVIEGHKLFRGVQTLMTAWEWAERFQKNGFRMAITEPKVLNKVWKIEVVSNEGDYQWYPDKKVIRSCFFTKPSTAAPALRLASEAAHPANSGQVRPSLHVVGSHR